VNGMVVRLPGIRLWLLSTKLDNDQPPKFDAGRPTKGQEAGIDEQSFGAPTAVASAKSLVKRFSG